MNDFAKKLEPGDVVEMKSGRLPSKESFRAAVESVREQDFSVFSTDLAEYSLSPEDLTFKFDSDDYEILKRSEASISVPEEAGGFHKGDRLCATVADPNGDVLEGTLVAAIDNLCYCITDDGQEFSAEIQYLRKVSSE